MTIAELMLFYRLDDEIYKRAEKICEELDLLYKSYVKPVVSKGTVIMEIYDYENEEVDRLEMTYEQFISTDCVELAKKIRKDEMERRKLAEQEAKKQAEIEAKEKRRDMYERLKKEFG